MVKDKKIKLCVISLDIDKPFFIDFKNLLDNNKNTLLCMIKKLNKRI